MKTEWQYQAFKISGGSLVQGLNNIGADGWEAVSIEHRPDHELVICKRPKSALFDSAPMVFPPGTFPVRGGKN